MSVHEASHPKAGETVKIRAKTSSGAETVEDFVLEDWWDKVSGMSWTASDGNPAAMIYGLRAGMESLPLDDEVVYGKLGWEGRLVHVSEIVGE